MLQSKQNKGYFLTSRGYMQVFFDSCDKAKECAVSNKGFGLYYSENKVPNLLIHIHDCCEVFLSLSDGTSFLIDDKVYSVKANDLFIINHFEAHKVCSTDTQKFVRYSLHIHPSFIHLNSSPEVDLTKCFYDPNKPDKISLSVEEVEKLTNLFNALKNDYGYGDELYKKIKTVEILLEVVNLHKKHLNTQFTSPLNKSLQLAVDYINKNFTQPISLDDVAKNSFISTNQLCLLFKKYLSTTVNTYIISKRITKAKKFLSEGKSVTETAFACGFNDYANFIRVFKKNVGTPPGKYKNNF